jgi:hypothetical protein
MGREALKRNVDNGLCLGAKYLSGGEGEKAKREIEKKERGRLWRQADTGRTAMF